MKNQLALTKKEINRKVELETIVRRGAQTFVEVGDALLEIRDSRLYRADFGTFEDYCRNVLGWSRRHANRLIAGAKVVHNLEAHGNGTSMSQNPETSETARPLTKLPAERQPAAWARAVESAGGGQPTAAQVGAVVEEVLGEDEASHVRCPVTLARITASNDAHMLASLKSQFTRSLRGGLVASSPATRLAFFEWVLAQAPKALCLPGQQHQTKKEKK